MSQAVLEAFGTSSELPARYCRDLCLGSFPLSRLVGMRTVIPDESCLRVVVVAYTLPGAHCSTSVVFLDLQRDKFCVGLQF